MLALNFRAGRLFERGADIRDSRDLLGHEPVATTEIYTHVSAARRRRVVQLLEAPGTEEVLLCPPRENSNKRRGTREKIIKRVGEGL